MVMKYTIEKSIRQCIPETEDASEFFKAIREKFYKTEKSHHISLLEKTIYDGVSGVHQRNPLKTTYNAYKEGWSMNDPIANVS